MNPITFNTLPATDKEYFQAFEKMKDEDQIPFEKARFGEIPELPAGEIPSNAGLQDILTQGVRVFPQITFYFNNQQNIRIERQPDPKSLFDKVTVNSNQNIDPIQLAKLAAVAQKHLGSTSLSNLGNLLGPEATIHFEAREAALARLEKLAADLLSEMEEARKRRESEVVAKEHALEDQYEAKKAELETHAKAQLAELDNRSSELDARSKELDDRAAKHARRQHYKEIKERFRTWSESFSVTKGTSQMRKTVYWFTLVLLVVFFGVAAWFLFQSITVEDSPRLVSAIVKQVVFTALFVSTAFFFIRWNNQWFQRHAEEEFRLKRMELDIDRASWFVEMAFEWKDEKGEAIPLELIDRLTHGLFVDASSQGSVEPADSLLQALVGAARFKVKLADGAEVEYDREGVQQLLGRRAQH
jgi:hypothetical protein